MSGRRLLPFCTYLLWPFAVPLALISALVGRHPRLAGLRRRFPIELVWQPVTLIREARREGLRSLVGGLVLLAPLLLFALVAVPLAALVGPPEAGAPLLAPHLAHPLGTDALGRDLLRLLVEGARATYWVGVVATLVGIGVATPLGLLTLHPRADRLILSAVQVVESVPTLVWLLMAMAVHSFWTDGTQPGSWQREALVGLRTSFMGVVIGLCYAPRGIRLLRDRVKFFQREEFVDMSRAHGVSTRRILWVHILFHNALPDLLLLATIVPGLAILSQLNLDYFFTIGSFKAGAAAYSSWTQLLLTSESRRALLFFEDVWLVIPPALLIVSTAVGGYLWGDGLQQLRARTARPGVA